MLATLLLVAVLGPCVTVGVSLPRESPPPHLSTKSLQHAYLFFRHGIRSPLYEPYPTDPNKAIFHKHFKVGLGELTTVGKKQMYQVGKMLSDIYGSFVGGFSVEKVFVSSTDWNRTVMSALSAMAGLFPPEKPIFKELPQWQPIPIWQNYKEFDKAYYYNDPQFPNLALKQCPRYGEMIQKGYNIIRKRDPEPSRRIIYELLQQKTGELDVNSINNGYKIYDILEMESLNGLPLPQWATEPQPSLHYQPLYPTLLRPIQVDWFYKCQWLDRDPDMLLFYSGPLFHNINEIFTDKIKRKEENKERFRYHSTHDDTILTLRWALGLDEPSFEVEAGDGIAFELHKLNDEYYVQVVYYHSIRKPEEFREVLHLKDCPTPCSYDQFSVQYLSLSPQDWGRKCKPGTENPP